MKKHFSNAACIAAGEAMGLAAPHWSVAMIRRGLEAAERVAADEAEIPIRLIEEDEPEQPMIVAVDLAHSEDITGFVFFPPTPAQVDAFSESLRKGIKELQKNGYKFPQ